MRSIACGGPCLHHPKKTTGGGGPGKEMGLDTGRLAHQAGVTYAPAQYRQWPEQDQHSRRVPSSPSVQVGVGSGLRGLEGAAYYWG